jgi:hypothetical protein
MIGRILLLVYRNLVAAIDRIFLVWIVAFPITLATVNRDVSYLRDEAKHNIKRYIDERLPEEYEKCLVGLTAILREAWNTTLSEDKDLLEEEQEEKAGEITTAITNQVF